MKNLIIILLVSIFGCGLVISKKQDKNLNYLTTFFNENNKITNHIFFQSCVNLQYMNVLAPEIKKSYQHFIDSENFIKENHQIKTIPKTAENAKLFSDKWNKNLKKYWTIVSIDSLEIASLQNISVTLNDNFYHSNYSFRKLLQTIQNSRLINQRIVTSYFFQERWKIANITFHASIAVPKIQALQINKSSTLPFPISNFDKQQYFVKKLWVNNQLVFEKTLENPFIPQSIDLVYNGINEHHVKVEIQNSYYEKPIYKERIFDFEISTCN